MLRLWYQKCAIVGCRFDGCRCAMVVGSIPILDNEIFNILILSLWCLYKPWRRVRFEISKWGMECFNTKYPLFTVLSAGYSVKLKNYFNIETH